MLGKRGHSDRQGHAVENLALMAHRKFFRFGTKRLGALGSVRQDDRKFLAAKSADPIIGTERTDGSEHFAQKGSDDQRVRAGRTGGRQQVDECDPRGIARPVA